MQHPNAVLMRKVDDALVAGDFAGFLALHTDDVVMHVPGRSPLAGDHVGRQALAAVFQHEMSLLDAPPEIVVLDDLGSDDHAASVVIQRMHRDGRAYEGVQLVLARVRDGQLAEVWFRPEDQAAFDGFFADVPVMSGFDEAIEAFRTAQEAFVLGDPGPALALYSGRDDVTLANPLGPPARGPAEIAATASAAAAQVSGGIILGYEEIARYSTDDLGYVVQIERVQLHIDGGPEPVPAPLRATLIARREDDGWRVCHRHADPITAPRDVRSIVTPGPTVGGRDDG